MPYVAKLPLLSKLSDNTFSIALQPPNSLGKLLKSIFSQTNPAYTLLLKASLNISSTKLGLKIASTLLFISKPHLLLS